MRKFLACCALAAVFGPLFSGASAFAQESGLFFYGVQLEEFEYRRGDAGEKILAWNGDAFVGTDELKFRWLGEGEYDTDAGLFGRLENAVVVQTPISEFFDLKGGLRLDTPDGPDRWYGLVGVSGLAPQWFEVDVDLFVSETGDLSTRFDVEYELLLTNRLILTPSAEVDIAFSEDSEIGIGSGLSSAEIGLRLSYDVLDRSIAPYAGVVYERSFGRTADFARGDGEDTETWFGVIGLKLLF